MAAIADGRSSMQTTERFDISDLNLDLAERNSRHAALRAAQGLVHDEHNGLYYVARHADINAVAHNTDVFSSAGGVTYFDSVPLSFVTMDDPEHARLRRTVSRQFTARYVAGLRGRTRMYVDRALDAIRPGEPVDVVDALTAPIPLQIISEMLGLPASDLEMIRGWTDAMMDAGGRLDEPGVLESATGSFLSWGEYVDGQVAARIANPGSDLLSALANSGDEALDRDALAMFATALMVAGNETTRHTASRGILTLATHPDQLSRLLDHSVPVSRAVEEILRWTSVARVMMRTVTRDTVVAGTALGSGDRVALLYPSGNRDELVFDNADRFLVDRNPNPHLAFGVGAHFCLGASLARMELDVILSGLLQRYSQLALAAEPVYRSNGLVDGLASLRVRIS
ncbi:MAG: cytochrome P450 [Mycobacterium sp.]